MNKLTLGWDLGGAHVKAVLLDAEGVALQAMQSTCPLWLGMEHLQKSVDEIMGVLKHPAGHHAVTMTGELADIFSSRNEGVQRLSSFMMDRFGAENVRIYAGQQGFVSPERIVPIYADIASANWHASASFLAAEVGEALLMDIGSTTSDMMVVHQGEVCALAWSDAERMRHGELIYAGVIRTPVMAVVHRVPFGGDWQGVAAEHFATMADVYRLTGDLAEGLDMADTADGAGKSLEESARRLARMVGRDLADADIRRWRQLAIAIKHRQLHVLEEAVERAWSRGLLEEGTPLLGAGVGRFLVRDLAHRMGYPYRDVSEWVHAVPDAIDWSVACLPAYAVGRLRMRELGWLK